MEILFIMELYAQVSVSAKIISFDRDSYFWEKRGNVCMEFKLPELWKICVLIFRNLPCPQKFLATCLSIFLARPCLDWISKLP